MNKTFGYARVSSTEQSLNRQLDALIAFGIPEKDIITDKKKRDKLWQT
ncbi:recombinase family protein [Anaeromassilibacillus sp. An172]|nr:recombinase family protein [Anaeromassilibacillus sp. An172]